MLQKPQHKGARRGGLEGEEGEHTQHRFGLFYLPRRGKEKAKSTTARASNLLPLPQPWGKPTPPPQVPIPPLYIPTSWSSVEFPQPPGWLTNCWVAPHRIASLVDAKPGD